MTLAARGLAVGYGGRPIVAGIDLALGPGGVLCLLGPNGCGKTTLFRTLLGLIPAVAGEVAIDGRPLGEHSRAELARAVAYVPQGHAPAFPYSALEVVLMGRTARLGPFRQPGAEDRRVARAAMERLGAGHLAQADYTRLSGGQRQLVLIARALAQGARYLVMDEPTASLDFGNQVMVMEEIAGLADASLGVVLSTHDPDQAFAIGSEVVLMHDGAIAAGGPPGVALTAERLSRVYGVRIDIETLPDGRRICAPSLRRAPTPA